MAVTTAKKVDLTQYAQLQKQLRNSPTAFAAKVTPTASDLKAEAQLLQLKKAKTTQDIAQMRADIYGTDTTQEQPKKPGAFQRFLDVLGAPARLIAGTTGKVLGKQNITNYGDLLRSYNVNKWVSLPLGLALDIAMDPVNWLTVGTAATIPKLVKGVTKGGMAGLAAAGKSAVLSKAGVATRVVGALTPKILGGEKVISAATKLRRAAQTAEKTFREVSGLPSVIEEVTTPGVRKKVGEFIAKTLHKIPTSEKYVYSPERWMDLTKASDIARRGEFAEGSRMTVNDFIDFLDNRRRDVLAKNPKSVSAQIVRENLTAEREAAANGIKKTLMDPPNPNELANKSGKAIFDELEQVSNNYGRANTTLMRNIRQNQEETGIKWFDKLRAHVFEQKVDNTGNLVFGERTVKQLDENGKVIEVIKAIPEYKHTALARVGNFLEEARDIFKYEKVPGNIVTALLRSFVGNLGFTGMIGVNVLDPNWMKFYKTGFQVSGAKQVSADVVKMLEQNPELRQFLRDFPEVSRSIGLSSDLLEESFYRGAVATLGKEAEQLRKEAGVIGKAGEIKLNKDLKAVVDRLAEVTDPRAVRPDLNQTFFGAQEVLGGQFGKRMEEWAKAPNRMKQLVAKLVDKTTRAYDASDKTSKIGTTLYLNLHGVPEKNLRRISQFVKLTPKDLTEVNGLYRFSPEAAMRVANTAYMNYAAMPAFVKMLRQVPVLGSPFVSFSYAMLPKIGQTLLYNPAIFNKINFTLDEIGRVNPPGPLEKSALASPYYNFLGSGDWTKAPFWGEYPLYVGIGKWLPYLSLNYFEPSERKYTTKLGSTVGGTIDKLPFMKDPIGQLLFDYAIQPWLLNESQPTGTFGQPLYRQSDTAIGKMGRAATSLAEAFVPPWLPPGYRGRQLVSAFQNKTPQGIPSTKSRWDLLSKAIAGQFGISFTDVDLENQAAAVQKTIRAATQKSKTTKK